MRGSGKRRAPDAISRARELRRTMGEPERKLWAALRTGLPDLKFRRQVPFCIYHADFCSHGARLIVEVDGDDHAARRDKDEARTRFLENEGYRVIRFANADVMQNIEGVVSAIAAAAARQKGRP